MFEFGQYPASTVRVDDTRQPVIHGGPVDPHRDVARLAHVDQNRVKYSRCSQSVTVSGSHSSPTAVVKRSSSNCFRPTNQSMNRSPNSRRNMSLAPVASNASLRWVGSNGRCVAEYGSTSGSPGSRVATHPVHPGCDLGREVEVRVRRRFADAILDVGGRVPCAALDTDHGGSVVRRAPTSIGRAPTENGLRRR